MSTVIRAVKGNLFSVTRGDVNSRAVWHYTGALALPLIIALFEVADHYGSNAEGSCTLTFLLALRWSFTYKIWRPHIFFSAVVLKPIAATNLKSTANAQHWMMGNAVWSLCEFEQNWRSTPRCFQKSHGFTMVLYMSKNHCSTIVHFATIFCYHYFFNIVPW